ncbi:multi-copper enzyme maturation ABC transporter permease [Halosimplex carlsbadense 2-9-1]|uniref:Multi-copper enzyme maturation ABC transporter permease n=1 Tax=Halosimplex carlsbadense 2-9-1 TaxID=797114 RepID=M0CYJ5_9EURY|nr:ABC transporter permease subunit [Halosimplex carlsbadense]ELZ27708.1 multi-copper enzyme maturation ABC transporter permease [Halosimplex carlsbadense 2-9-1]
MSADTGSDGSGLDGALRDAFDWYPVAKKEFRDAIRSKGLWVLSFLFTALFVIPAARNWWTLRNAQQVPRRLQEFGLQVAISRPYLDIVTLLVPIVVVFAAYAAVSDERTSGSLKVLLSLPFSRRDVIVGKVVGRSAVVGVPLLAALGLTGLFFAVSPFTFKAGVFAWFVLYTVAFTVVFTAVVVSISGAMSTNLRSLAGAGIVYFYLSFGWNALANSIGDVLAQFAGIEGALRWQIVLFVKLLSPTQAYKTLTNSMLGEGAGAATTARYGMFQQGQEAMGTICGDVLGGNPQVRQTMFGNQTVCQTGGSGLPFYFSDPAVFASFLVWIGLAAAISYYTFDRVDL